MIQFILLVLIQSIHANALIGTDVKPGGPGAVCLITSDSSNCSGTLITPLQIITAGHCVDHLKVGGNLKMQIHCGYKKSSILADISHFLDHQLIPRELLDLVKRPLAEDFDETLFPQSIYINPGFSVKDSEKNLDASNDFALINLVKASSLKPLNLLTREETSRQLTEQEAGSLECFGSGYGINNNREINKLHMADAVSQFMKSYSHGMINTAQEITLTSRDDINHWREFNSERVATMNVGVSQSAGELVIDEFMFLDNLHLLKMSLMPGDSGGPLFCRRLHQSVWSLAGVYSFSAIINRGFINNDHYVISQVNSWAIPDINQVTEMIWSAQDSENSP